MRTIGLDLAISGTHKAVIADEQARIVSPAIRLRTDPNDLGGLLQRSRDGAASDDPPCVVMEPTCLRARTGRPAPCGARWPATSSNAR